MSLQTLLDGCCSGPILILGDDGQFRLDMDSVAVVQDIRLLSDILLDWKIWAKAEVNSHGWSLLINLQRKDMHTQHTVGKVLSILFIPILLICCFLITIADSTISLLIKTESATSSSSSNGLVMNVYTSEASLSLAD